jgi:ribosome-binding factor A
MAYRIEKINHLLRKETTNLLRTKVKDPRLSHPFSITEVATSADLSYAKVYVSGFLNEQQKAETMEGLMSASNFIRSELGRSLKLKQIPKLNFEWDDSIERGTHILEILEQLSHS